MFLYVPLRIPLRHCTFPFISERFSLLVNQRVIQNILILENYHKITSHVLRNKQHSRQNKRKGFWVYISPWPWMTTTTIDILSLLYIFDPIECLRFICLIYSIRKLAIKKMLAPNYFICMTINVQNEVINKFVFTFWYFCLH